MKFRVLDYNTGYGIYSVAADDQSEEKLRKQGLPYWRIDGKDIRCFPDEKHISIAADDNCRLAELNDFDVIEVFEDGLVNRCYDDSSSENVFIITEKCNSNCVMCPSPDQSRRNGGMANVNNLIEQARHIPDDATHFTITGGEPFMMGKDIFDFIRVLKEKFRGSEVQILTNGRVFALQEYCALLAENRPDNTILGIPLHASNARLHDSITRAVGSFNQTVCGIANLLESGIDVEIRIVVNRLNMTNLSRLADFISSKMHSIKHVSIMGMEMTGNAWINRDEVWVPYSESFGYIKDAVKILIDSGIDVWLYNYPLCVVDPELWTLCKRSISSYKVRYKKDECDKCRLKDTCGGLFAGTYNIEESEIRAIL